MPRSQVRIDVETLQSAFAEIDRSFCPKADPAKLLAEEIEKCRRKICHCVQSFGAIDEPAQKKMDPIGQKPSFASHGHLSPKKPTRGKLSIEFEVNALRVIDLRKRLKNRNADCTGVKKDLRARLLSLMYAELDEETLQDAVPPCPKFLSPQRFHQTNTSTAAPMAVVPPVVSRDEQDAEMDDVRSDVAQASVVIDHVKSIDDRIEENTFEKPVRVSSSSVQSDDRESDKRGVRDEAHEENESDAVPTKTLQASPLRGYMTSAYKAMKGDDYSSSKAPKTLVYTSSFDVKGSDVSPPASDASLATSSMVSTYSKMSGSKVREMVSKISSASSVQSGTPGTRPVAAGSVLSKSLQAKKEARLKEIRGKTKPLALGSHKISSKEYTSNLSSLNKTATSGSKPNLSQQMREKALRKGNGFTQSAILRKENYPLNSQPTTTTGKRPLVEEQPDKMGMTYVKGTYNKKAKVLPPVESDGYEISDREEENEDEAEAEETDSEAEEARRNEKRIPTWAKKENLRKAWENQNIRLHANALDPDEIFPEVQTCDLSAIFPEMNTKDRKKRSYRDRSSSGNWTRDRVTMQEKLVYKRAMGFTSKA